MIKKTIHYMNYGDGVFKSTEKVEADNCWDDVKYSIEIDEEKLSECETLDDLYYTAKGMIGPDYDIYNSEGLSSLDVKRTKNEGYFMFNLGDRYYRGIMFDFKVLNNDELYKIEDEGDEINFEDVKIKYAGFSIEGVFVG